MFHSNGKFSSLGENCFPVIFACDSPSFVPCHFHCLAHYPTARWCALNFLQQSRVNGQDGGYGGVRGDGGCEQGMRGKEFHYNGEQTTLMAKNGALDLGFGWEPTPTTTLAAVVPHQASPKVGVGRAPLAIL
jgi:hypothetical protein